MNEIRERIRDLETLIEEEFGTPKLSFCIIPLSVKGSNLRSLLSQSEWDAIRRDNYRRACYVCEICKTRKSSLLHCHEEWKFDIDTETQELMNFIVLCEECHQVKHFDSAMAGSTYSAFEKLKRYTMEINRWSSQQFNNYFLQQRMLSTLRGMISWKLSIAYAFDYDISPDYTNEPDHRRPKGKTLEIDLRRI